MPAPARESDKSSAILRGQPPVYLSAIRRATCDLWESVRPPKRARPQSARKGGSGRFVHPGGSTEKTSNPAAFGFARFSRELRLRALRRSDVLIGCADTAKVFSPRPDQPWGPRHPRYGPNLARARSCSETAPGTFSVERARNPAAFGFVRLFGQVRERCDARRIEPLPPMKCIIAQE
jgi:hypothetical protein